MSSLPGRLVTVYRDEGVDGVAATWYWRLQSVLPQRVIRRIQRTVAAVPTSDSRMHEYWKDPDDEVDQPENHLELERESRFLLDLLEPYLDPSSHVMEIGCNVGRNLKYLYDAGYENLTGIELNDDAVALMAREYPAVYDAIDVYNEPVEEVITRLPDDSIDVTFTFALLAHIPIENEFVFDEIVRVTDGYVVTFENERTITFKQVPRNYLEVFAHRGCEQVHKVDGEEIARRTDQRPVYRARVLATPPSSE